MMIKPTRTQWLFATAVATCIGLGSVGALALRVSSGEPLFVDYGAECKKQGPGAHVFIQKRDDGTQKTSVISCDGRSEFRNVESR